MRYIANAHIDYIQAGVGDLPQRLGIRLRPWGPHGEKTEIVGGVLALISLFTALANYYQLSLAEIKEKFA